MSELQGSQRELKLGDCLTSQVDLYEHCMSASDLVEGDKD
jgi:hypothetical protein